MANGELATDKKKEGSPRKTEQSDQHEAPWWRRFFLGEPWPKVTCESPDGEPDLRAAVSDLWRQAWINAALALVPAIWVIAGCLGFALIESGLELNGFWEGPILARTEGFDAATLAVGVAAVTVTFFVAHTIQSRSHSKDDDLNDRARNVILDHVVTWTAWVSASICWLLVFLPDSSSAPRNLGVIVPIAAALLCSTLSTIVRASSDTIDLQTAEKRVRAARLRNGLEDYKAHYGVAATSAGTKSAWRCFLEFFPWPRMVIVSVAWFVFARIVTSLWVADLTSLLDRDAWAETAVLFFFPLTGCTLGGFMVGRAAESVVSDWATGRTSRKWWQFKSAEFGALAALYSFMFMMLVLDLFLRDQFHLIYAAVALVLTPWLVYWLARWPQRFNQWVTVLLARRVASLPQQLSASRKNVLTGI